MRLEEHHLRRGLHLFVVVYKICNFRSRPDIHERLAVRKERSTEMETDQVIFKMMNRNRTVENILNTIYIMRMNNKMIFFRIGLQFGRLLVLSMLQLFLFPSEWVPVLILRSVLPSRSRYI